jgi:hypothetical protein
MENLTKALSKILDTVETVFKAYEDKKVNVSEWIKIGASAVGWIWIFKHLPEIKVDINNATEEGYNVLMETLKAEFDIPQDKFEDYFENALGVVVKLLILVDLFKMKKNGTVPA